MGLPVKNSFLSSSQSRAKDIAADPSLAPKRQVTSALFLQAQSKVIEAGMAIDAAAASCSKASVGRMVQQAFAGIGSKLKELELVSRVDFDSDLAGVKTEPEARPSKSKTKKDKK